MPHTVAHSELCLPCRLGGLVFVLAIQVWVGWTFLSSQWERASRETQQPLDDAPRDKSVDKKTKVKPGKAKAS